MITILPTDTCYGLACPLEDEAGFRAIYQIKGRDFRKPLAFLVRSFEDIRHYTEITDEQLGFLRDYPHPFTLLSRAKTHSLPSFLDPTDYHFVGLRVAERCITPDIRDTLPLPMFLTSANRSGEPECRDIQTCVDLFTGHDIKYVAIDGGIIANPASDIFGFIEDTVDVRYTRRNYAINIDK